MVKCDICGETIKNSKAGSVANYHLECYLEATKDDDVLTISGNAENSRY